MVLGSTQSLIEMRTRGISWKGVGGGERRPVHGAHNLATFMSLNILEPEELK